MRGLYKMKWYEYERGWGRKHSHDTWHLSKEDAKLAERLFLNNPSRPKYVPDYYIQPEKIVFEEVTEEFYQKVLNEDQY